MADPCRNVAHLSVSRGGVEAPERLADFTERAASFVLHPRPIVPPRPGVVTPTSRAGAQEGAGTVDSVPRVEALQVDDVDVASFGRELCQSLVHAFAEEHESGVSGVRAQRGPGPLESG